MPDCIRIETIGPGAFVAHLKGEIDVTVLPQLEGVLKPLLEKAELKILVLHCRDLRFIDSKVVGFMAYLRTNFAKNKRQLFLAETNETVNDILSLVGLNQIIPHFGTLQEALKSLTALSA